MVTRGSTIPADLQLAFLADRMVNSLASQREFSDADKEVFKKAKALLDDALDGSEVVKTGQLHMRAAEHLGAYGLTLHAYASLAQSQRRSEKEDIQQVLRTFRQELDDLASGISKPVDRINTLKEFFTFMRDIGLQNDKVAFDEVSIGNRGSHGIAYYR